MENSLAKTKDEKGLRRVAKFLTEGPCPDCGGTRLSASARGPLVRGISLAQATEMTLDEAVSWVEGVPGSLPDTMRPMAKSICESFTGTARRLLELGLGYLTLSETTPTLSGGEAQRLKLASEMGRGQEDAVFVFDEPTIGLHPRDVETLLGVFERLVEKGATVVVVEHDLDFIANADYVIDMGPHGGKADGHIVACGTPVEIAANPESITGRYLVL